MQGEEEEMPRSARRERQGKSRQKKIIKMKIKDEGGAGR